MDSEVANNVHCINGTGEIVAEESLDDGTVCLRGKWWPYCVNSLGEMVGDNSRDGGFKCNDGRWNFIGN